MTYKEEVRDLFSVPDDYYLAHCISADFNTGKGIVVEFDKRFGIKEKLQTKYPNFLNQYTGGNCLLTDKVFNLVTKPNYWSKPTYRTLKESLVCMKDLCIKNSTMKIAMPVIGCGLDRLEWNKVSEIIKEVFADTDIEILVCRY